jgi:hypothetical protein
MFFKKVWAERAWRVSSQAPQLRASAAGSLPQYEKPTGAGAL